MKDVEPNRALHAWLISIGWPDIVYVCDVDFEWLRSHINTPDKSGAITFGGTRFLTRPKPLFKVDFSNRVLFAKAAETKKKARRKKA